MFWRRQCEVPNNHPAAAVTTTSKRRVARRPTIGNRCDNGALSSGHTFSNNNRYNNSNSKSSPTKAATRAALPTLIQRWKPNKFVSFLHRMGIRIRIRIRIGILIRIRIEVDIEIQIQMANSNSRTVALRYTFCEASDLIYLIYVNQISISTNL